MCSLNLMAYDVLEGYSVSLGETVIAIVIAMRMIALPTKKVSSTLEDMVGSIERNEGDLTTRAQVRSNDEIGQLAGDINVFRLYFVIKALALSEP